MLFFIAGAFLFALDRIVSSFRGDADISVPASVRVTAAADLKASLGRPATEDELRAAVDRWIREEAVYREGLRRGLDRSDRIIRERVVLQTLTILQREHTKPDVDDSELERWFSARIPRFTQPDVFDLEVMTVLSAKTDAEVNSLIESLNRSGQPVSEFGSNHRLHIYRDAPEALLARSYGAPLVTMVRSAEPGQWFRAPSTHALLIVRVHQVRVGEPPRFQDVRSRVLDDWRREQREQALEQHLNQLVGKYRIRH